MRLAPSELKLMLELVEHIYPDPEPGTVLPLEREDLRPAGGMARKGLVVLTRGNRPTITFTAAGAAVYRELSDKRLRPA